MEVNAVQVDDLVYCIEEQVDEQSLFPEGSDVYNVYGDPDIFHRVGEQYQVEIPPLMSQSDYYWFQENSHDAESTAATPRDFLIGLPIPIIWIKDEVENKNNKPLEDSCKSIRIANKIEFSKLECIKEGQNILDSNKSNPKHEDSLLVKRTNVGESGNSNIQQEEKIEMHEKHKGNGYCLVPGSSSDTWNEIEEASFILGLYIYGKNLFQVKRFIGSKKMGDILSFYYGKFYNSDRYQRWSECRKMRSRKCIYGQKIFTGARQQELLSRLLPNVSEECCNNLCEVSKTFADGKMLLENYVLTLKASVGMNALVEAVGIGKGKEDLTGLTVDSLKSIQALPVRPEIPVGKACSMLKPAEIITFLTGDFRLSKARSSDLFWEAVWPRLLARGWHSEQPGSHNYALASKNSLVFLVPGVKRFSRKLVRGNQYFDSVSDVLGKVASDPELIELEAVADNDCRSKEGNEWTKETKLHLENSPDQQRHCYLKPRTPNYSTDVMKFTVVDTSLASENMRKVRELRSLPVGVLASTSENDSDNEDTSEEQTDESESANTMCFDRKNADITKATKGNIGSGVFSNINGFRNNPSREELTMGGMGSTNQSVASEDQKTDLLSSTEIKNVMKSQSSTMIADNKNILVPVTKRRRRLTACSRAERNCSTANIFVAPTVKQEEESFCRDNSNSSENVLSQENPLQENKMIAGPLSQENKISVDPLSNSCSIISREPVPAISSSATEDQHEQPQMRTLIDLNLPVLPEVEANEPAMTEMTERQENNTREDTDDSHAVMISKPADNAEQPPNLNPRRQSTRNRPLTAKVLEAFASGYLDRKEKRKSRDYLRDSSTSRPSRRTRGKNTGETSSSSGADFQKEEIVNVMCNGSGNGNRNVILTSFKSNEG